MKQQERAICKALGFFFLRNTVEKWTFLANTINLNPISESRSWYELLLFLLRFLLFCESAWISHCFEFLRCFAIELDSTQSFTFLKQWRKIKFKENCKSIFYCDFDISSYFGVEFMKWKERQLKKDENWMVVTVNYIQRVILLQLKFDRKSLKLCCVSSFKHNGNCSICNKRKKKCQEIFTRTQQGHK